MSKKEKLFKSPAEQINILANERNLKIHNKDLAIDYLTRINYYNLVNGYKKPFIDNEQTALRGEDWYREEASIDNLLSLYEFDKNLSSIIFPMILRIESEIKMILSVVVSAKSPDAHREDVYLARDFFNQDMIKDKEEDSFNKFIKRLQEYIDKEDCQPYIKHYKMEHNYVPLWVLTNAITFGDLTKYYKFLKPQDRHQVTKILQKSHRIDPDNLYLILQMIRLYRNILAHDEKFYSIKARNTQGYRYVVKFNGFNGLKTQNTSFATLVLAMKLLVKDSEFNKVRERIIDELHYLEKKIDEIALRIVIEEMGFSEGSFSATTINDIKEIL